MGRLFDEIRKYGMLIIMFIFLLCLVFTMFGCTNEQSARRILKENGYSNIEITGYNLFACSGGRFLSHRF